MTKAEYQLNKLEETLNLMKLVCDNLNTMPGLKSEAQDLYEKIRVKYESLYNEING